MGVVKYTGPVASFHCPTNAEIRSLKVHFSPKQAGTGDPSPENLREIEGYNQIKVELGSENLTQFSSGTTTWYKPTNFSSDYVTYYGLIDNTLGNTNVKLAARTSSTYYSDAVKPGECGAVYIKLPISNVTSAQLKISNASTNTIIQQRGLWPYVAEKDKLINFDKTIYGGWVDLISGEVSEEYTRLTLDENIPLALAYNSRNSVATRFYTSTSNAFSGAKHDLNKNCYVNIAKQGAVFDENTIRWFRQGGTEFNIYLPNNLTGISSEEDDQTLYDKAHAYLLNHHINYVFALQTPNTYHLAPTQLQTFLGQNNVWSNADYVEVEYDLHETQDILARKQFIMANQPHVETLAPALLQSFSTDMVAPLKECKVYFEPVQDLHGYDKPWPAGGGKNLFPYPYVETTKTDSGITFTDLGDGQIKISGTNSNSTYVYFILRNNLDFGNTYNSFSTSAPSFVNGDYTLKFFGMMSGVGAEYYESGLVRFRITAGATINTTVGPTIYKTSDNLSAFEPYENICPISGWTGANVQVAGKNLVQITPINGRVILDDYLKVGETYSITADFVDPTRITYFYLQKKAPGESDYSRLGYILADTRAYAKHFTVEEGTSYAVWANSTYTNVKDVMLVHGSTESAYKPYNGRIIPVSWETEAGTVHGGYIDLITGNVYNRFNYVDMGTLSWNQTNGRFYAPISDVLIGSDNKYLSSAVCDIYPTVTYNDIIRSGAKGIAINNTAYIRAYDDDYSTIEDFISAVDGHMLVYPLAVPILLTTLTPIQLKTLRGTNNIWSNANGNIELSYWTH